MRRVHMEPFSLPVRHRALQSREFYYRSRDHPNAHELSNHIRHPSPAPGLRSPGAPEKALRMLCFLFSYSEQGLIVRKQFILNKSLVHLIDHIFWFMAFKTETQAEEVMHIIHIIPIHGVEDAISTKQIACLY